jgi:beta-galactosidase
MKMKNTLIYMLLLIIIGCGQPKQSGLRKEIVLNGEWEITKTGSFDEMPIEFGSKVPVPGFVDLAVPSLDTNNTFDDGVYWYKTNFTIDRDYPELVQLRIGKSKYNTRIYLNDIFVGEQLYNFTSAVFNLREFLNLPGESNELLIGVGTVDKVPDTIIWGHDFEKLSYIPGIYDNVKLTLTSYPFIRNIQTVPLVEDKKVLIVADIDYAGKNETSRLSYAISELETGKVVAKGNVNSTDFEVHIPDCQLWSPESPFLYKLELSTQADNKIVRFGMRSFSFDAKTGRAILNGKPYYMRGTNVTIGRFFEDPERGLLPWDDDWVILLHERFKEMHWNSIRYCIGLPPERWYDIADSIGFLLQNEYPVWTGGRGGFERIYPGVTSEHLANEYRAWLQEQWNHASIAIWAANNESVTDVTGDAINMVRDMDLSDRPWENGWSPPQSESDPIDSHPYFFSRYRTGGEPSIRGPLADFFGHNIQVPLNDPNVRYPSQDGTRYDNPIIINEYAWLWLNRDGTTTTLTDRVYDVAFGSNLSTEQRRYLYARHLGMLTEYWRTHRLCAGVLHFCGLGYSRSHEPRGQTSDHFTDLNNLRFEPLFVEYVKPSFAPVGLMIDFWDMSVRPEIHIGLEVYAINDLDLTWNGPMTMSIYRDGNNVASRIKEISIPAWGREITTFVFKMPEEKGDYLLEAEIKYEDESIKSIREFAIE